MKYNQKMVLPLAIVFASIILGGFLYAIQVNKQNSIEKQQLMNIELKKQSEIFVRKLECGKMLDDLKKRWNNINGIYYSELLNTCMVKYTRDGEIEEAPLESMQDL